MVMLIFLGLNTDVLTAMLVFLPPAAVVLWFAVALARYLTAPRGSDLRRARRIPLICASVLAGVMIAAILALVALLAIAIKNM